MATDEEMRSIGFRLLRIMIILCMIASFLGVGFGSQALAEPLAPDFTLNRVSLSPPLLAIDRPDSTLEPLQAISVDASSQNPWLYTGIVQLAYAGIIAWIIALLQKGSK